MVYMHLGNLTGAYLGAFITATAIENAFYVFTEDLTYCWHSLKVVQRMFCVSCLSLFMCHCMVVSYGI